MFIKLFINYIIGYVKISVEGYYLERFINICTKNNILIWDLKREKSVRLFLNIGIKDFKKISKILKETKCRAKIESKHGIPFVLNRYRKRRFFLALLIVVILGIHISSNFIWHIEIKEESGNELDNIVADLKNAGLKVGKFKSKIDTKDVIEKLRLNRDDIAWAGIELKGTNAIVKIVKADKAPEIINEDEVCNIVASKSGLITKVNSLNGTARVKEGDVVQKGAILIEGVMEGKFTEPRYVHASGEVQAKVWYTKSKVIKYSQEGEKTEENIEQKINLDNFQINFPKRVSKTEFYDTIESLKQEIENEISEKENILRTEC